MKSLLELPYEELKNLFVTNPETREQYKSQSNEYLYELVKNLINNGAKHIQLGAGCIKVKKNVNGTYYVNRNGLGNGSDLCQYLDLKECVTQCYNSGWFSYSMTKVEYR